MKVQHLIPATALTALAATSPALAHTGVSAADDALHGVLHPLTGADHLLAMVAVGLFAAQLGGRALWLVPASFVAVMAAAGAMSMNGLTFPFIETGIALSVLALGLMLMLRVSPPTGLAAALVGVFAVFHGYAHGAETPADASGLAYALGFLAATAALHATGVALGLTLSSAGKALSTRLGGGAIALAGAGLLAGWL